jgi:cytochrome c oxidase cbb3-type subunit 3
MRISPILFLLLPLSLILPTGCNSGPASAPASAASASKIPVGPIPGAQPAHYEPNPLAGNPGALQDGRRLFLWYNCYGCHGGHGGGGMGPSLRDDVWIFGGHSQQIFDSIAQGRGNGMPAWGSKIPQEQIWQLVAYIKSMRTPQEPAPPVEPTNEMTPNPVHDTMYGLGAQTAGSEITEPSGASSDTPPHSTSEISSDLKADQETSHRGVKEPK